VTWVDRASGIDDVSDGNQLHGLRCATAAACTSVGEPATILCTLGQLRRAGTGDTVPG
jgi:hypothetical protein